MTAVAAISLSELSRPSRVQTKEFPWDHTARRAPVMVATMHRYLDQLAVSSRPTTVVATSDALRFFAGQATRDDPALSAVAGIARGHIEAHKTWMATRPGKKGRRLSPTTICHRLGFLRTFFERIMEWGYDDTPDRQLVFPGDFPERDEQLPKFLDDPTAAKFMAALAADPNKRRRLIVELLARTGMRASELGALESDAMVTVGDTHWLRIPVGKLHNDRYVPCTRYWSSSSASGRRSGRRHGPAGSSNARTASPTTAAPCTATSSPSPSAPASVTSTRTSCATPWRPRPSTGG
jgi:integrase